MKSFGTLLKKYINEASASINSFAHEIELDRGWLNNVFTGKKALPIEKLEAIFSSVYFSDIQKEQLRTAFFYEYFGKAEYEQVCELIKRLQSDYTPCTSDEVVFSCADLSRPLHIKNDAELLGFIGRIMSDESIEQIYTNFSFAHRQIDSVVYNALKKHNKTIGNYHHFTTFKIDDHSTYNIECFFEALKYIKQRLDIRYKYESNPREIVQDTPFPYFFITSGGLLQYDENAKSGLWMPKKECPINVDSFIQGLLSNYAPIAIYSSSPLELQGNVSNFSQMNSSITGIDGGAPCLAHYLDKRDFELLANPDLENRDALIEIALDYFSFPVEYKSICTYKGLYDFALNGKLPDLPTSFVAVLPNELRVKVFDSIITEFSEKPELLRILNEKTISFPSGIVVDFYHGMASIALGGVLSESYDDRYYGEFFIPIQETSLRNVFMNGLEYIKYGGFAYSVPYTAKLLEQLRILASSAG